jgi:peptidoglycan LD-endopeptidase LytH
VPDGVRAAEVKHADTVVSVPASAPVLVDSPPMLPAIGTDAASDSLVLTMPVDGVMPWELRDTFGDPRSGYAHEALDIMAPRGTRVLSAASGRLTKLHTSVRGGIMVYAADATDRYVLMYGHLERYADGLTEGMSLAPGQLIGYVGATGSAAPTGPHLHFAIARGQPSVAWWKGEAVNPYPLLYRMKPR